MHRASLGWFFRRFSECTCISGGHVEGSSKMLGACILGLYVCIYIESEEDMGEREGVGPVLRSQFGRKAWYHSFIRWAVEEW